MKIFLDDIRDPPDSTWEVVRTGDWLIARSYTEAVQLIQKYGLENIDTVSFDHDLGTEKTGLDFAHFLIDLDLDSQAMPDNFSYNVHSANPVGRANIVGLLDGYLAFRRNRANGTI